MLAEWGVCTVGGDALRDLGGGEGMLAKVRFWEDLEEERELRRWVSSSGRGPGVGDEPLWLQRRQLGKVGAEGQIRASFIVGCSKGFGFNWKGSFLSDKNRIREEGFSPVATAA